MSYVVGYNLMKKIIHTILFATALFLPTTNYANALIIGTFAFSPPFVIESGGYEHVGFDVEIMNSLCNYLHKRCIFKTFNLKNLKHAIRTNKIDLAIGGITVTQARERMYLFSMPYLVSKGQFLIKRGNTNIKSLKNKRIGTYPSSIFIPYIKQKLEPSSVTLISGTGRLMRALKKDMVDLVLIDSVSARWWVNNSGGEITLYGDPFVMGNGYAIMVSPKNAHLLPEINKFLFKFVKTKEYQLLFNNFILQFAWAKKYKKLVSRMTNMGS